MWQDLEDRWAILSGLTKVVILFVCIIGVFTAANIWAQSHHGGASGSPVASERASEAEECERFMQALDKTKEILEDRGGVPAGERAPSAVLEERWGDCPEQPPR